jgi:hypothetical protein
VPKRFNLGDRHKKTTDLLLSTFTVLRATSNALSNPALDARNTFDTVIEIIPAIPAIAHCDIEFEEEFNIIIWAIF